ncbi:BC1872 family protein [Aquibacillus saliphilus]|uniref:BC1872 family protein n=1 Tax=Aquibacillus saliphilus TaxID=1909422 RepID=UPI001CF0A8A4|nr:hypothetical protein [Aquibacillus saliphilus]
MNNREINELIVEHVLKLPMAQEGVKHSESYIDGWLEGRSYSTNISDAWELVEKLREEHCEIEIGVGEDVVNVFVQSLVHDDCDIKTYYSQEDNAPLAICKAILKYKGITL